ncbi:hypothetical protein [Rhodospira trueperi]|uniref:Uncharacterized protein n=1 Tax=Rhodospira trueperi TaxID=69960 RepID=A0A1G7BRJ5_9PROT|nr:hypothetical protein [Rhodospira trueperi]SDE29270.1 hypothetical protein SAMN05421720_105132 [Rhodospira trueperi]
MTPDAVTADTQTYPYRVAPRPVYEGQPYYTFDEVVEQFSFWDVLDIFNPLQHIPLVNMVYRELTGDEIGSFARVAGGALFGGGMGAVAGIASAVVYETTGKDPGELVLAAFTEDTAPTSDPATPAAAETLAGTTPLGGNLLGNGASTLAIASNAPQTMIPGQAAMAMEPPTTAPLGAMLLASESGRLAAEQAAAQGLREGIITLDSAQSAALSAYAAHAGGGPRPEGPARPGPGVSPLAMPDGAPRGMVSAPLPTSPDQQSQHNMSHDSQTPAGQDRNAPTMEQPQSSNRSGATTPPDAGPAMAMPADIQRGREALRERLAAARPTASVPTGRPTGMTLADYRANPNRRGEDGSRSPRRASAPQSNPAINSANAARLESLLPQPAAMAGLQARGQHVAAAAAERARRIADGSAPPLTAGGTSVSETPGFRALPVDGSTEQAPAIGDSDPSSPVVSQPWFSQRVFDAMRRYDAERQADANGAPLT